jgi:hypothetical protein
MAWYDGPQISSIVPEEEKQRAKKFTDLRFKYDTSEYDSYVKNGLEPPDIDHRPDKFEFRFLNQVDTDKGKVKIRIPRMFRIRAIDYEDERQQMKEYLYYETVWTAKNWRGNEINPVTHVVGMHKEQTLKVQKGDFDPKTGHQKTWYIRGQPRVVYTIPFSKEAVDKALEEIHPFGPDSINMTDKDSILYYGKFSNILGLQTFRCADYTYEQFVIKDWNEFLKLAIQEGGPAKRIRFPTEEYATTMADVGAQIARTSTTGTGTGTKATKTKEVIRKASRQQPQQQQEPSSNGIA